MQEERDSERMGHIDEIKRGLNSRRLVPRPAFFPPEFTHLAPLPVSGNGMDGSRGRFSIRSCESESPAFGLVFVVAVAVAADAVDADFLLRDEDVPKKSTSSSCSAAAEPRREPRGVCLVEPPPGLEVLLVRRERARRKRPKSVDVAFVEVSTSTAAASWAAATPPSMTRATVVAGLLVS